MIRVKFSWGLGIIQKLGRTFPGSTLKCLFFFSRVQSYVSYCPIVWIFPVSCILRLLSVMHNKARRLVVDTNRSSQTPLSNLQSIYTIFCASFVLTSFMAILQNLFKKLMCLCLVQLRIAFLLHIVSTFLLPLLSGQISIPSLLVDRSGITYFLQYRDTTCLEFLKLLLRTI